MTASPSERRPAGSPGPSRSGRHRTETAAIEARILLLAVAGWIGAATAIPATGSTWVLATAIVLGCVSAARRRLPGIVVAVVVVTSCAGARAEAGYSPVPGGPFAGSVLVVGDPRPASTGWQIEVRLPGGDRVDAGGYGRWGTALSRTSVGDTVSLEGRLRPVDGGWFRTRHVTGRLIVDRVGAIDRAGGLYRIPETLRNRIEAGASTMSGRRRALYLGLVIGDDRFQPLGQRLRFRTAGLSHLLAVSGQNVALVAAVAKPALERMGYRGRFLGLTAILVVFAVMTRLEPSVLRATATALIAAWAAMTGRQRSAAAVLGLAVLGLVCVDPFLVDAVGFQLSVAASAGIIILGPALERRLRGPGWLRAPLATTLSAQLGVSPLLAMHFGPVPLVSVSANLLAGWAAALIMTIGMTVGMAAGLSPPPLAAVLQHPAGVLLWWLEEVAAWHTRMPSPRLGPLGLLALVGLLAVARTANQRAVRRWAMALAAAVAIVTMPNPPDRPVVCGTGIEWFPAREAGSGDASQSAVLILRRDARDRSVERCMDLGIHQVDILIVERGDRRSSRLVAALDEVMDIDEIVAPPRHRVLGARRLMDDRTISNPVGMLVVKPDRDGRGLTVWRQS